ncbi:MAG TPA: AmmeMemoRadiSam system radical SAM enzyme [Oscillospiraceae bacterium]|nr:AmmeMemoRadiSam system radical SAM enzyme [Oscillospiraceae bacterium]HPK34675.1 AmmeMemoRadiSam system radical SAM enzyme [Oscillospiraceae bacterium]HPR74561.1 AmmeMemoRadiSam system radical SAM enzyme [Oscillospiraceae bacterium]
MICGLCPHHCDIPEGRTGFCRARENRDGKIVCGNYGRLTSLSLDPIEKKPLYRFYPGSMILSAGSYGCNLACPFCQNCEISMADRNADTVYFSPEMLVERAKRAVPEGNIGLAFTYNEPLIWYEYVRDCAKLLRENGLKTVLVTNGMICLEPLLELLPLIDAMNIDLKGFSQKFYDLVKGDFETVKQTIALSAQQCHVEVTTLVIPGLNDDPKEIEDEAKWLASVNPEIPLHLSRFFPRYKMNDHRSTPIETIYDLRNIAAKYLKYVFFGNC